MGELNLKERVALQIYCAMLIASGGNNAFSIQARENAVDEAIKLADLFLDKTRGGEDED